VDQQNSDNEEKDNVKGVKIGLEQIHETQGKKAKKHKDWVNDKCRGADFLYLFLYQNSSQLFHGDILYISVVVLNFEIRLSFEKKCLANNP